MKKIPQKIKKQILANPFYKVCARKGLHGHECAGRITWEHALIFGARQVQAEFAIIPLCAKAHSVDDWQDKGDLDKEKNVWIALNRATEEELSAISKVIMYSRERRRLNEKYGPYTPPALPPMSIIVDY